MRDLRDEAQRGFPLSLAGDPVGVSCDENGPSLGPVRLLDKTNGVFAPRAEEDLDAIFGAIYGRDFSSARLRQGLAAVARALNDGQMARAIFSTQHLRLSSLTANQASRALEILQKGDFDEEKHPRWPEKTPDSQGGRFRSKDAEAARETGKELIESKRVLIESFDSKTKRKMMTIFARKLLTWRILGEALTSEIPVVNLLSDALLAKDVYDAIHEAIEYSEDIKNLSKFIDGGPYNLDDLKADRNSRNFLSFDAFKKIDLDKFYGAAGDGFEWHHIVEQGANRETFLPQDLQSTDNIIRLPKLLHQRITSGYASSEEGLGQTFRKSLSGKDFGTQYQAGIEQLKKLHILKD